MLARPILLALAFTLPPLVPFAYAEPPDWNQTIDQARQLRVENRLSDSLDTLTSAWKFAERSGADPYWKAAICHNLGLTYLRMAEHSLAERFLDRALRIWLSTPEANTPELVTTANALAWVYLSEARLSRAKALLDGTCRSYAKSLGPYHYAWAGWRSNEAGLLFHRHDFAGAKAIYREVLDIWEMRFGKGRVHVNLIPTLNNIATCDLGLGDAESAIRIVEHILDLDMREIPAAEFQRAHVLLNGADAYAMAGRKVQAHLAYEQAALLIASVYPEDHPMIAEAMRRHAYALKKWGQKREANALFRQAEQILDRRPIDARRNISVHVSELQ